MKLLRHLLAWVLHLVTWPIFVTKTKLRRDLWARYWWRPELPRRQDRTRLRIWAHGASAGDVLCLQPLLSELSRRRPLDLVVTAFTASGVDMARARLDAAAVRVQPFDLPGPCARAAQAIDADLLLLERAELWPCLIDQARRQGTQVALINGRLSPGALPYYRLFFALMGNPLRQMRCLLMRDDDEAARAQALGAPADRVFVTGNTKLDRALQQPKPAQVHELQTLLGSAGPLLVAGSTHEGEEAPLLDALLHVRREHAQARLLIAPRYPERTASVEQLARARELSCWRRSSKRPAALHEAVLLLDSLGELSAAYALADLAFVGGSLIPRGGQNMLEPAALGVPVLVGPHTFDARDQIALLQGQGLKTVTDARGLASRWSELLADDELRAQRGRDIQEAVQRGTGASQRAAQVLLDVVGPSHRTT